MKKIIQDKGRQGVTLVEVIVVAVIVLILSAVAIPMYNGYVMDARISTANNLAETAAAAANTHWRRTGACPTAATDFGAAPYNLHYETDKHTIGVSGENITVNASTGAPSFAEQSVRFRPAGSSCN
ncbi:MAG: prepilin-type N-terminal cleavage/methylation domain-containing protein [Chitinispirillales bacterium]|jgi:prepilin-type N-terminal cleavage/methylation domain-containing protein|nr:prepilin-type N-terminal cleavage/methylation domain-containing protein [Chitinispirillales bacterium]